MSRRNPPVTSAEPLPLAAGPLHGLTLFVTAFVFWLFAIVAGYRNGFAAAFTTGPQFDWIPAWGTALQPSVIDVQTAYMGAAIAFYAITIGGQLTIRDARSVQRVRIMIGIVGMILAVAALFLTVLAIAATPANPASAASLVVVVPMTVTTWILGINVGQYTVPSRRTQLILARARLFGAEMALRRLAQRPCTSRAQRVVVRIFWPGVIAAGLTAAAVVFRLGTPGDTVYTVAAFTVAAAVGMALIVFGIGARVDVRRNRRARTLTALAWFGAVIMNLGSGLAAFRVASIAAPSTPLLAVAGFAVVALLPTAFTLTQKIRLSPKRLLIEATRRSVTDDADRAARLIQQLRPRVLDEPSWMDRLTDAYAALRGRRI